MAIMARQKNETPEASAPQLSAAEIAQLRVLLKLAALVEFDVAGADLVIRNRKGSARLIFKADGTLRAEGVRIINSADETLLLDAAAIALN